MEETLYLLTRLSFFFDFLKRFEGVTDVVSLPLLTGTLLFGAFSAYVVYQVYCELRPTVASPRQASTAPSVYSPSVVFRERARGSETQRLQ